MPNPTLRTLARELGLSRTTVSDALCGSNRVKAATAARVLAAAKAAGYQRNPLTGAVMSQLRRSRGQQFRGVLGAIDVVDTTASALTTRYNRALLAGITRRAETLGFTVERFEVSAKGVKLSRLDTILHTRGIQGLVLLPAAGFPDLSELSWERYTAVYADYFIDRPTLHCVCLDHYRSMVALLQELHVRGYRRPGLVMDAAIGERLQHRWEGAFLALTRHLPGVQPLPPLHAAEVDRRTFETWFREHEPDVVLGHFPEVMAWMRAAGARLPRSHGFVCLNRLRTDDDCAALDFQTDLLGARATELVVGQLLHNELGVPSEPSLTTIPARLVEGPTLRPASASR
jgi:DNA-binding LacI/PurR family transcriptional regulator